MSNPRFGNDSKDEVFLSAILNWFEVGMSFLQDWRCNPDYKIRFILILYRLGNFFHRRRRALSVLPYCCLLVVYKIFVEWFLGVELPLKTMVGRRLTIYHGVGLVVHSDSVIGDDVVLRNGVIIGNNGAGKDVPVLSNRVDVGGNSVVIGGVHIGKGAKIGAGVVVTKDVPEFGVVVSAKNRYL